MPMYAISLDDSFKFILVFEALDVYAVVLVGGSRRHQFKPEMKEE